MWNTLIQHLTLLICIVPIIGACLVLLTSQWGRKAMRMTAIMNVGLSCVLSIIAVSCFQFTSIEKDGQQFQFESVVRWPGNLSGVSSKQILSQREKENVLGEKGNESGEKRDDSGQLKGYQLSGINIRLGMDGVRLCFVCLISFIMIPVVLSKFNLEKDNREERSGVSSYSLILLAESLLLLMITSLNFILYLISFQLLILVFYLLIGHWGGKEKLRVNKKYLTFQMAGMLLVSFGLILAAYAHSEIVSMVLSKKSEIEFSISKIVHEIPPLVSTSVVIMEYWEQFAPWVFWSLLVGFLITAGLFPFHTWFSTVNSETPASVAIFLSAVSLKIGLLGLWKIVFPLFPELSITLSPFFTGLFLVASVYLALLTLAQDDLKKMGTYLCLSQMQLIAAGLFTLNHVAAYGAILMMVGHGVAFALYFYLVSVLEIRFKTREMEAFSGLSQKYVWWSVLFCISLFSLVGIPGFVGFAGNFVLLAGILQTNILYSFPVIVAFLLQGWALFWMLQRILFGEFRVPETRKDAPLSGDDDEPVLSNILANRIVTQQSPNENEKLFQREGSLLLPLVLAIVLFGIVPGWILKMVDPTQNDLPVKNELETSLKHEKLEGLVKHSEQYSVIKFKEKLK